MSTGVSRRAMLRGAAITAAAGTAAAVTTTTAQAAPAVPAAPAFPASPVSRAASTWRLRPSPTSVRCSTAPSSPARR